MSDQEIRAVALQLGMQIALTEDLKLSIEGTGTSGIDIFAEATANAAKILPQVQSFIDPPLLG